MAEHSVVFNMRIQLPGAKGDGAAQITHDQMMTAFDLTHVEGRKDGWHRALIALREAVENGPRPGDVVLLDEWIRVAAESRHCPHPRAPPEDA